MEEEWIRDVVWVRRDKKNEWTSELQKEFEEEEFEANIKIIEEIKKDLDVLWLAVEVIVLGHKAYEKYKEYKKRKQEEGFPVRNKKPD